MKIIKLIPVILSILITACADKQAADKDLPLLKIAENKHFLSDSEGNPFFWLGDTGWLLFLKLNREEAGKYLEDRKRKGFNVIQAMVLHDINRAINIYGDSALIGANITTPKITPGDSFEGEESYDFWDHVDYIIHLAEEKGIYMALVPLWGSNVTENGITSRQASVYGAWLANRYKDQTNIIWLNGGDIFGSDSMKVWKAMGNALRQNDPNHLITFHPRGRMQSSQWFHNEPWLDFNMVQSGHRNYEQDDTELNYGEDNWRYIETDYNLQPVKPTIDGEPSYEGIPQGLHDTLQPYWTGSDVRRYGYWSVFAGAFGFTYGHNAVMQFYSPRDTAVAYGPKIFWEPALNGPGAGQMAYLKDLILSKPFFERIPDQSLIAYEQGNRYDYLAATRGNSYAFIYTYTGRNMPIAMGKIKGNEVKASWYDPRNGSYKEIGSFPNSGIVNFDPPGETKNGNDWVLVLSSL